MRTFHALILPAAVALIALASARADELQPPYVCKEWTAAMNFKPSYEKAWPAVHILQAWVDGWLEGYKAAHPEAENVLPGHLERYLNEFCPQHKGETLIEALKRADLAALEAESVAILNCAANSNNKPFG